MGLGNLDIGTINGKVLEECFLNNLGFIDARPTQGDLITLASAKTSISRVFGSYSGLPSGEGYVKGDNDFFCICFQPVGDSNFCKLQIFDVRSNKVFIARKTDGTWKDWTRLIDSEALSRELGKKVDKEDGKILTDVNFTREREQQLASLVQTNYFRGYYETEADIKATPNPQWGYFGFVRSTKTLWYFNKVEWEDLHNVNTGDMRSYIYDPRNKATDMYDRANHDGEQAISTITGLQDTLDSKLNKSEKTVVVDNFSSNSPDVALSGNCGSILQNNLLNIIMGQTTLNYPSKKEANGYAYLPNNILIQWGRYDYGSYTNKTVEVPFNIEFKNSAFCIIATPIQNSSKGSGCSSAGTMVIDNTKFSMTLDYATTQQAKEVSWFAIGY